MADNTQLTPHGLPGMLYGSFTKQAGADFAATLSATATVAAPLTTSVRLVASFTATATRTSALTTTIGLAAGLSGNAYLWGVIGTFYYTPEAFQADAFQGDAFQSGIGSAAFQPGAFQADTFQTDAPNPLEATPTATATITAQLTTAIRLSAPITATATMQATGLESIPVGPWALLAVFNAFNAVPTNLVQAFSQATATVTAALTTQIAMAAPCNATAQVGATLLTTIRLVAAPTATATVAPAPLTTSIRLAAAPVATATIGATLTAAIGLGSAVTATAQVASTLQTTIRLVSTPTATASLSAVLIIAAEIAAPLAATATLSANLQTPSTQLAAALAAQATTSSALTTSIHPSTAISGTATITAALTSAIEFAATLPTATAMTAAALTTAIRLASSVSAVATVTGDMRESATLPAALIATAQASGALTTAIGLAAGVVTVTTVAGTLQTDLMFSASLTALAEMLASALELPHGEVTLFPVPERRRLFPVRYGSPEGWVLKTPAETFDIGVDFTSQLTEGEWLASVVVTARDSMGSDSSIQIVPGLPSLIGGLVTIRCLGGTAGERHLVQFQALTSLGNSYEAELQLSIEATAYLLGYAAKQPAEIFPIGSDFAEWLAAGEAISAATVTAQNDHTGLPSTGAVLIGGGSVEATRVLVRTHGGVSGERHLVRFQIPTSQSNVYEAAISLPVEET
jgi:hypothetical protein